MASYVFDRYVINGVNVAGPTVEVVITTDVTIEAVYVPGEITKPDLRGIGLAVAGLTLGSVILVSSSKKS